MERVRAEGWWWCDGCVHGSLARQITLFPHPLPRPFKHRSNPPTCIYAGGLFGRPIDFRTRPSSTQSERTNNDGTWPSQGIAYTMTVFHSFTADSVITLRLHPLDWCYCRCDARLSIAFPTAATTARLLYDIQYLVRAPYDRTIRFCPPCLRRPVCLLRRDRWLFRRLTILTVGSEISYGSSGLTLYVPITKPPPHWKRSLGRPCRTWLKAFESDPRPLKVSLSLLGRLFWVDLIKCVSNVRPSVRPQKVSSISVKSGM